MSPGEIKSREVALGSSSRMGCLATELFLNSCVLDTVFVTLLGTAVKTTISEVRTGEVPITITLLVWRWQTVSSVFAGTERWDGLFISTSFPSFPVPNKPYGFCKVPLKKKVKRCRKTHSHPVSFPHREHRRSVYRKSHLCKEAKSICV